MVALPTATWVAERAVWSIAMLIFLWVARTCWKSARANQKLALSDFSEYNRGRSECRGLLLPVSQASHVARA